MRRINLMRGKKAILLTMILLLLSIWFLLSLTSQWSLLQDIFYYYTAATTTNSHNNKNNNKNNNNNNNNNNSDDFSSVVSNLEEQSNNNRLNTTTCIESRGTNGYWYIDKEMGRNTFYVNGYRSRQWFKYYNQGNRTNVVYPGNKYAWKDTTTTTTTTTLRGLNNNTNNNNKNTTVMMDCQIHPVNKISFCETMYKLQIKRILFVGDSLMGLQRDSLLSLLGEDNNNIQKKKAEKKKKKKIIYCSQQNFSISYDMRRENLGPNYYKTDVTNRSDTTRQHRQQFGGEIPYCSSKQLSKRIIMDPKKENNYYCPWNLVYNKTNQKTLLILNQGAHFHSIQTFSSSFDLFVDMFNSIAHSDDIVIYRNTVPGHYDCFNVKNNISYLPTQMTYNKFLERYETTMYDWNLFDTYNQYAKEKLFNDLTSTVTMHYLNVYNMTILRSDEHMTDKDCLHYSQPGPIDYWNHLLFTNLADIAK